MKTTLLLFIFTLSLIHAAEPALNGVPLKMDPTYATLPQSKPITLEAKDMPIKDFVEKVTILAGFPVGNFGLYEDKITLLANEAPTLHVLLNLAKEKGWELQETLGQEGRSLQFSGGESVSLPIRGFDIKGPFALVWFGKTTVKDYNFSDPQNPIPNTKYRLSYVKDPAGHLEEGSGQSAIRDIPITFVYADGSEEILKSDHKPNTFKSGEAWEFEPRPKLDAGVKTIKVTIPFFAATKLSTATFGWKPQNLTQDHTIIEVSELISKEEEIMDPKDFFNKLQVTTIHAKVHIIHPEATTGKVAMEDGIMDGHSVVFIGKNGERHEGKVSRADGMHGPPVGYTLKVEGSTPRGFVPEKVEFQWANEYKRFDAPFQIDL